ncbi:digestive cysteine proteinase 1-like [Apostichopus japonicus]|uniref:digestive cysteine proteinase 1-like n=1 Tax=Stichopus japonicus TaxID=307972 RepID=UPI003AB76BD5
MDIFKTLSILLLAGLAASLPAVSPPTFGSSYHARGNLKLPYAELDEPFEFYFDANNSRSHINFYHGLDHIYTRGDMYKYGTTLKISPETVDTSGKACFQINGTADAPVVTPQNALPDLTGFKFVGAVELNGQKVNKWVNITKVYSRSSTYTFYTTSSEPIVPVQYVMMGYDSLLGSHYDKYIVEYTFFDDHTPLKESDFAVPEGMKCRSFPGPGVEHHIVMNPLQEIINPEKGDRYEQLFDEYKNQFGKNYEDKKEHTQRLSHFRQNVRYIHSKNRQNLSYRLSINHLADQHKDELGMITGRLNSHEPNNGKPFDTSTLRLRDVPDTIDWRIAGAVTQVKDQAVCGSCWSFGSTGTIEGAYFLKYGKRVRLSQQNLVDCSWAYGNNGCDGGEEWRAYDWIMKNGGLQGEEEYGAYIGQNGKCHFNESLVVAKIKDYTNVTSGNQTELKIAIATKGPVAVGIDASHLSFAFYADGVYFEKDCGNTPDDLDHAVLAVGYGNYKGQDYWLVKNSWSTYWGNDGYVLMSLKDNNCGVATDATFVDLK